MAANMGCFKRHYLHECRDVVIRNMYTTDVMVDGTVCVACNIIGISFVRISINLFRIIDTPTSVRR